MLIASTGRSQASDQRAEGTHHRGVLGQNQPNPFSAETTIPFTIGDANCAAGTQQHVVTLRIYNILSQIVAVAALADSNDADAPRAGSGAISSRSMSCGSYVARWDGKRALDGREAPAGVYMYQLLIDGHPAGTRKMLLKR